MGAGAAAMILVGSLTGSIAVLGALNTAQWIAGIYLGIGGGAPAFILWVMALARATPTRVASTMTVNPIAAGPPPAQLGRRPIPPPHLLPPRSPFSRLSIATAQPPQHPTRAKTWPPA